METFLIDSRQKQFFLEQGYLHISNAIPQPLINKWKELLNAPGLGSFDFSDPFVANNICFLDAGKNDTISRINSLLGYYQEEVLELMSFPSILKIAEAICGTDSIPMQCDALFKHPHPFSEVAWHQDAIFPRQTPYINIGIYLDDANPGDGCIRLIPGTQNQEQNINSISQRGADIIDIPAKEGDIIIHDLMTVHSSSLKVQPGVRRTIYLEWWSASAALNHGYLSENWIEQLKNWKSILLQRSALEMETTTDLLPEKEVIEQLLTRRESPAPANYGYSF